MAVVTQRTPEGTLLSVQHRRHSDFHNHYRWWPVMRAVAPQSLQYVKYALGMPNNNLTNTGVIKTMAEAFEYHAALMRIAEENRFEKLSAIIMTLYYTNAITTKVIEEIAQSPIVRAVKYYTPHAGATTGSGHGIPFDHPQSHEILAAMQANGVRLLIHGESVEDADGNEIPHPLREAYFIKNEFRKLRDRYPTLLKCLEHISTEAAVEAVKEDESGCTVATVTPQHAFCTQSDFDQYGTALKCMPIVKTDRDRAAILTFITSGDKRAIAGTDDAPHQLRSKNQPFAQAASGCRVPQSQSMYVAKFEEAGAIDKIEDFTALNGPQWWGFQLPAENDTITVRRVEQDDIPEPVEAEYPDGKDLVVPLGWHEDPAHRMKVGYAIV